MFKNTASSFMVFAFDATTNTPKTGDAANITAYVSKDYGAVTVLADTSAVEMDATNAKGYYLFSAAQAETNADCLMVSAKSATANIVVIGAPSVIYTRPTTNWLAPATLNRTLVVDAAGLADANVVKVGPTGAGTAQTAGDIIADTNDIQARLPAALVSGRIDASVGAMAANVITAAATAADFGAEIATAIWTDTTAADFTVALSVGKSIINGVDLGTGLTINAYTGNTAQTGDSFARIGAAGVGLTAVALADVTSDAVLADAIWNAATATYGTAGSYGLLVETDLDAAISTRMATYVQPTGFLAATFPAGTIANTTNITAGTITTTTNLTNLPAIPADWITAAGIATGAIDADAVAADAANEIADALLNRNVAGGSSAGRLVKESLYVLRNKTAIAAGTLTVYQTDDLTTAFTAAVTTAAGNPIDSIDPT